MPLLELSVVVFSLIIVGLVSYFLLTPFNLEIDASDVLTELEKTEIGRLKLKLAREQAERNGVGIVIHEGNMYTIRGSHSHKLNSWEYYKAVEKSMEEKQGIYRKD